MYVEYRGWSEATGCFYYNIFINEASTSYKIQYENGFVAKQTSAFENYTMDWNNDGEIYTQFGAWFESRHGGVEFYTPEDLVRSFIDGIQERDIDYNDRVVAVIGIDFPNILNPEAYKTDKSKRKGK